MLHEDVHMPCRGVDRFSYSLANDRASHEALHAAQRQAEADKPRTHTPPVEGTPPPQIQAASEVQHHAEQQLSQLPFTYAVRGNLQQAPGGADRQQVSVEQAQQQHHASPSQQTQSTQHAQQAASSHSNSNVSPASYPSHMAQQGSPGAWASPVQAYHEPQLWSNKQINTPAMTTLPGSHTPQDPQQQLLQHLAVQAGFQLLPPPVQSPALSSGSQAAHLLPNSEHAQYQQHQRLSTMPAHASFSPGLSQQQQQSPLLGYESMSQGLLQQLGHGLQSSAMQLAAQQQQQQSRLPAWAQQALGPEQQQQSPGSDLQSILTQSGQPTSDLSMSGHFAMAAHDQNSLSQALGFEAAQGGSWQTPWLQQQQQQQQIAMHSSNQWPKHHLQLGQTADQNLEQCQMYIANSPLDLGASLTAAAYSHHGVSDAAQQEAYQLSQLQQQHSSQAARATQSQDHEAWNASHRAATSELEIKTSDCADADLHAESSGQGPLGVPVGLSGGSSGLSSPLRESGLLESLIEVNNRVEAATERARAQLQVPYLQQLLHLLSYLTCCGLGIHSLNNN